MSSSYTDSECLEKMENEKLENASSVWEKTGHPAHSMLGHTLH